MSPQALRSKIEHALDQLDESQLKALWSFLQQLGQVQQRSRSTKAISFWDLEGAGDSGYKDVGRNKHKYLAEAYKDNGKS
jgi:hypothetical protein